MRTFFSVYGSMSAIALQLNDMLKPGYTVTVISIQPKMDKQSMYEGLAYQVKEE